MHVRMHACFSYVYSTRIQHVYAAVHSYSCICLLRGVACSLGVIAYILVYVRSLPSSSTVMYLVRLSYRCHAEVNFDASLSLRMLLFH